MKPTKTKKTVRLLHTEYVETAYAQLASGPGWANSPIWIVITDAATGKTRKECLQPSEQTPEMLCIYHLCALAHASLMNEVRKITKK